MVTSLKNNQLPDRSNALTSIEKRLGNSVQIQKAPVRFKNKHTPEQRKKFNLKLKKQKHKENLIFMLSCIISIALTLSLILFLA